MPMRLAHLWSARAKYAVLLCLLSSTLPGCAAYFLAAPYSAIALGLHYGQGEQCLRS